MPAFLPHFLFNLLLPYNSHPFPIYPQIFMARPFPSLLVCPSSLSIPFPCDIYHFTLRLVPFPFLPFSSSLTFPLLFSFHPFPIPPDLPFLPFLSLHHAPFSLLSHTLLLFLSALPCSAHLSGWVPSLHFIDYIMQIWLYAGLLYMLNLLS